MLVSIIIPAYKQENTIKRDIENIRKVMSQTRWSFEIIVVVDGFEDKTYEQVKELEGLDIRVFGYEQNRGKGYAVRYGMAQAVGEIISFIDSGMDIDASGISMLLEHMVWYDADVIVGSKRHPVSQVNYPSWRKIYSWGYHTLVRLCLGVKVKDTQTGLKIFKREVLEKVLPRLLVKRFAFDVEILAVSKYLGFSRIYEAPVKVDLDLVRSNFDKLLFLNPNIRRMLLDTLAIFYRMRVLRYYADDNAHLWELEEELLPRVLGV